MYISYIIMLSLFNVASFSIKIIVAGGRGKSNTDS